MQVALWGLRGGAGTTTITAMLGDQLAMAGQSVLLVDLNPADMLRLHFNVPYGDDKGWASDDLAPFWRQQTHQVNDHLTILPYGYHRAASVCPTGLAERGDTFWVSMLGGLASTYDWVLYDVPQTKGGYRLLRKACSLSIVVAEVDMASHILLEQSELLPSTRILVNRMDPAHRLSRDILLAWRQRHSHHLLSDVIHQDQNIHEAFAHKLPVRDYCPASAGTRDIASVARWCRVQRKRAA